MSGGNLAVSVVPLEDTAAVDALCAQAPTPSLYQTPVWAQVLHRGFGMRVAWLVWTRGSTPVGYVPVAWSRKWWTRRVSSLPFTPSLEPVWAEDAMPDAAWDLAWTALQEVGARGWIVKAAVPRGAPLTDQYVRAVVPLDRALEEVRRAYAPATARGLRKAKREGVAVRPWRREDVGLAARLFVDTRRRQGVPTYPQAFLTALESDLLIPGRAQVWVAEVGGRPVSLLVCFPGTPWVYAFGASVADAVALRARPNNALFDHAIAAAHAAGAPALDLGPSPMGHDNLRRFKRQWGASEESVTHTGFGVVGGLAREGPAVRSAQVVLRHCPRSLYQALSEVLIRLVE